MMLTTVSAPRFIMATCVEWVLIGSCFLEAKKPGNAAAGRGPARAASARVATPSRRAVEASFMAAEGYTKAPWKFHCSCEEKWTFPRRQMRLRAQVLVALG